MKACLPSATRDYTYCDPYLNCFSCIDHFNISHRLGHAAFVLDDALNTSKHRPIAMMIDLPCERRNVNVGHVTHGNKPIAWHKVNGVMNL